MVDRAVLVGCEPVICVEFAGEGRNDIGWREGVVGPEQDSVFPRESHETRQSRGTRRQCRVEMEALKALENVGRIGCIKPEDVREFGRASCRERVFSSV